MTIKIILPLPRQIRGARSREFLHQNCRMDYTHILEATLENWRWIRELDSDALQELLAIPLRRRLEQRRTRLSCELAYARFMQGLSALESCAHHLRDALGETIDPICENIYGTSEVSVRLAGWLQRAALLDLTPLPREDHEYPTPDAFHYPAFPSSVQNLSALLAAIARRTDHT